MREVGGVKIYESFDEWLKSKESWVERHEGVIAAVIVFFGVMVAGLGHWVLLKWLVALGVLG